MGAKHKNRRRGVTHEIERRAWTDAEIDVVLNEILPLDNAKKLHIWESRIAEQLNRGRVLTGVSKIYGSGRSRKPIDLLIWKIASGYGRFRRYQPGQRVRRDYMPWTWMEKRVLKIAFDPANDAAKMKKFNTNERPAPTSPEFISLVLARQVTEVISGRLRFVLNGPNTTGFGL